MRKFINSPESAVSEALEGLAFAAGDILHADGSLVISNALESAQRVTVAAMGAAGSEPWGAGFTGFGMADVFASGGIFAPPGPAAVFKALELADRGRGVLLVVPNQTGSTLSASIAVKLAAESGIEVKTVLVCDDCAEAARSEKAQRRGLLGVMPVLKAAGAAANSGMDLGAVCAAAEKMAGRLSSFSVLLASGTHLVTGEALAGVTIGSMRLGTGLEGEGGAERPYEGAEQAALCAYEAVAADLALRRGDKVLLLLSGSGAMSPLELWIIARSLKGILGKKGMTAAAIAAGEYLTLADTDGFTLTLAKMDDELLSLWQAPCRTPCFRR